MLRNWSSPNAYTEQVVKTDLIKKVVKTDQLKSLAFWVSSDLGNNMAEWLSPLLLWGKLVFDPIYRNTKSFFKFQSNLSSLQKKKRDLKEMEDVVKQQLDAADKDGKSATPQVKEWLRQVGEILVVAEKMEPGMIADNRGLISGCFLSCGVCRKARKTLEEVERLADACPAETMVANSCPVPSVEHIPGPSIEGQTTATKNLNQVMDLLSRDEIQSVGIWGMGGVGKTTLVKNLNNKLKSDGSSGQRFGTVIWATVSKDFNRKVVQTQIANRLKLRVGESDEDRMTIRLHERLMKETNFVLILDDVWEAIDLDRLGIPDPQVHEGVKILITSRLRRVCENMKTNAQVQVRVLNEDEAWELFVEVAGNVVNSEEIKPVAWEVCKQCCGLPLAVVIVGAAMRGKDMIPLWKDALSELERSMPSIENIEEKVFKPLKWSYDKLQGNDVKSCFLYCCLYPEDYSIEVSELVKCWMGEGFIDEELNYEKSRNRGLALIQNLKEACLLETGVPFRKQGDTVKMHDVVRDVAIWISSNCSEDGCKFLVRAGIGLSQVSQVKFSRDVKRISFMNNQIHMLPCNDACWIGSSNASTLFLQGNSSLAEIPDEFLRRFQAIKVLNLSNTNINSLPPSIVQLTNLETLIVRRCRRLKELPRSGWEGFGRLQTLDLADTAIWELPTEMARLIKLRELDLFCTKSLKSIPAGVFSMLSSLEILNMVKSGCVWGTKGAVEDGEAYLEELESLDTLCELFIQVKPKSSLSWIINPSWINGLRRFTLCIGVIPNLYDPYRRTDEMIMNGINPAEEERTEYLLSTTNATSLYFYKCAGLDKLVQNMGLNTNVCFSAIKWLNIECASVNLTTTYGAKCDLLPNLEYLNLEDVQGMRSISELAGHLGLTFSKLQHLRVKKCDAMKYLLSVGPRLILESLVEITIRRCESLELLFEYVAHPQGHSVGIAPNLKKIVLDASFKLRTLCKGNEGWASLETIHVIGCDQLRKLPISGQDNNIKEIEGEESWWSNLEWDDPNTKTSLQPIFKRRFW